MPLPATSITLLSAIASNTESVRWAEFLHLYEQPLRAYLQAHFPTLEAEDILQEAFLALMRALPTYRYTPDEQGHFHNYLIGIVKHKAADALRRRKKESSTREHFTTFLSFRATPEDDTWKDALMSAALDQLLADTDVNPTHREIFRHVALLHESPEAVAAAFGLTRNNVDQIKRRMLERMSKLVSAMVSARDL